MLNVLKCQNEGIRRDPRGRREGIRCALLKPTQEEYIWPQVYPDKHDDREQFV